jgi:hypothetical protein
MGGQAGEECSSWLVCRVLRLEPTLEGSLEDRLPQPCGVGGFSIEHEKCVGGGRKSFGNPADDFGLFVWRWNRKLYGHKPAT